MINSEPDSEHIHQYVYFKNYCKTGTLGTISPSRCTRCVYGFFLPLFIYRVHTCLPKNGYSAMPYLGFSIRHGICLKHRGTKPHATWLRLVSTCCSRSVGSVVPVNSSNTEERLLRLTCFLVVLCFQLHVCAVNFFSLAVVPTTIFVFWNTSLVVHPNAYTWTTMS